MNKFKHPPSKPHQPFSYVPPEPQEFLPPALKELGTYTDGVALSDLELPEGISLGDLYLTVKDGCSYSDGDSEPAEITISYPFGDKRRNPRYARDVKYREEQLKVAEEQMAVYEAQLVEYKKAKAEYDAFWRKLGND